MNLLIVDDELWSRKLIRNLLNWDQYGIDTFFEAGDGEQALEIIGKHHCDLMITDMRMPGIDGAMLLKKIHDDEIDIEIIVMSGYEDYKYLHSALKTKAIDYLLKPVVKHELHSAVLTGIHRIQKNNSYSYIEDILVREDLKYEINKYHELKNQLMKAMLECDEKDVIKYLTVLESVFFTEKVNPNFTNYILMDLKRKVLEIEKENHIVLHVEIEFSIEKLGERMLQICQHLTEQNASGKISILEVQKYIDKHLEENITLAGLSNKYFVSKEHLSRLFKKEVGITVQQYITGKKIEYAKSLLRNHKMIDISTIAIMCGYHDLQYFYRIFKKDTGLTPLKYRNQYQDNARSISI